MLQQLSAFQQAVEWQTLWSLRRSDQLSSADPAALESAQASVSELTDRLRVAEAANASLEESAV